MNNKRILSSVMAGVKIMINAWCGKGVDGWLNAFDDSKMPLTAEYEWIRFTPFE